MIRQAKLVVTVALHVLREATLQRGGEQGVVRNCLAVWN